MRRPVSNITYLPVLLLVLMSAAWGQQYTFTLASSSGSESTSSVSLEVTFYHPGGGWTYGVGYSLNVGLTNASGSDYSFSSGTLNFTKLGAADTLYSYVPITVNSDAIDEWNENIVIDLAAGLNNPTLAGGGISQHTYTITDDDGPPDIQFTNPSSPFNEVPGSYNVEVSLSLESGKNISVDYTVTPGTALGSGVDYTRSNGTVFINGGLGLTTYNIPVQIVHDVLDEFDETLQINLEAATLSNAGQGPNFTHTVTIQDNDPEPTVYFTNPAGQGDESLDALVQFRLDAVSGRNVQVDFTLGGSTADGGGMDYTTPSTTVIIPANQISKDITITVFDDVNLDEDDETIILTLDNAVYGQVAGSPTPTHTYTILDNDPLPTIQFNGGILPTKSETPPGDVTFTVDLAPASGRQVTVDYAVGAASTATGGGTDFTIGGIGTLTFPAGDISKTFTVTVADDIIYENNEDVVMELSTTPSSNATLGGIDSHTLTITDNDPQPTIGFSIGTSSGNESVSPVNLLVTLSDASGLDASVYYSATGGTALGSGPSADYSLTAGRDTIPGNLGLTSFTIPITINDNSRYEPDEDIVVTLASEVNAALGTATHTYTILNDDSAPTVSFAAPTSSGDEFNASPTVELALDAISDVNVTVDYSVSVTSTATSGVLEDYVLVAGPATITAGNLSVNWNFATINPDELDEDNETIILNLLNPTDAVLGAPATQTHTFSIIDDDPDPEVSVATAPASVSEIAGTVQFTINLSAVSGRDVDAAYTMSGTANGSSEDYFLADGTATITAGNNSTNLMALLSDDIFYENDETLTLTLSSPVNAQLGNTSHTITLTSNDPPPEIQFSLTSFSGSEGVSPVSFQIETNAVSNVDATVEYNVTGGSATGGGVDFTLASGTATVDSGQTITTISAIIEDDLYDETPEDFIITLTNPGAATLGANASHTYTIIDDDDAPTVFFATLGSTGDESISPVDIPVVLSSASALIVTVDWDTSAASTAAGGGTDYSLGAGSGTLTFSPGDTVEYISPTINDDQITESDETIVLTLSGPTNAILGIPASQTHTYTITDDDPPPADFTVGAVTATGGADSTGYWNAGNTGLEVTVPVDNSAALTGGTIQLQAKTENGSFANVGPAAAIVLGDLDGTKVISLNAAQVEGISGFADDSTLFFTAIITDAAGNSTTGTVSATTITVDQTAPAAYTTGLVETSGGDTVAGYWNATNTGIVVAVPLASDLTLSGGSIQLRAEADGAFEDLGAFVAITQTDVTSGSKTLTVAATEVLATGVEELLGYSDGDVLTLRSVLTDAAGNTTTGAVSSSTLIVDETAPSAAITYSDTLANQGDTVTITVTFDVGITASPAPTITVVYAFNSDVDNPLTATADPAVWTYGAIVPGLVANDGLATVSITARDMAGNMLPAGSVTGDSSLTIDNTPPGYVLAYSPDSLVQEGDLVTITATAEESVQLTTTLSITFAGSGPNISDSSMSMGASDSVWTFVLQAPAGNDGFVTVTVTGVDLAGNALTPISGHINTLKVDNTPPDIALTDPVEDDYVRTTAVSYTLGEDIASGWMKWEWEAGATDGNAPHTQALAGAEISAGAHTGVLTNAPTLVQAAAYTIQLIAGDGAGNYDTVAVTTVTYDTLAPAISGVVVTDGPSADVDSSRSTDTLAVHYGVFPEAVSGISRYEYALGSTPGGTDVVDWTANGTDTLATVRDLDLVYRYTYYFSVRATDGAGNVSDSVVSDGVIIVDKPRLTVNVVQNSVVARYIQILVTDTLAMADSIRILVDSVRVSPTVIDTFSYLGTHQLTETGTHSLQVTGFSGSGDTLRTASLGMSLAKRGETWIAASVDQHFTAVGLPGAVSEDRHLLVIDSTLMATGSKPGGAYRLGDGRFAFREPVQVSMLPDPETRGEGKAQAIYILRADGRWEELPSVDDGDRISAWARKTGTFRLGRRTIMVPQTTHLRQNYPNPFNPATRIIFDLGLKDGPVQSATVKVYDLLGRQIRTLYHGQATIGRYELVWAGSDDRGVQVASGIYFVQLTTSSGHRQTRKMLLIR